MTFRFGVVLNYLSLLGTLSGLHQKHMSPYQGDGGVIFQMLPNHCRTGKSDAPPTSRYIFSYSYRAMVFSRVFLAAMETSVVANTQMMIASRFSTSPKHMSDSGFGRMYELGQVNWLRTGHSSTVGSVFGVHCSSSRRMDYKKLCAALVAHGGDFSFRLCVRSRA